MSRASFPDGFSCLRCDAFVSVSPRISGVRNRNHCPYCLWSRHVDWRSPGDRLSSCKGGMQPIGLTIKKNRNKYSPRPDGELMVVHRCMVCSAFSINRIAADDGVDPLMEVFHFSLELPESIRNGLHESGIHILARGDAGIVSRSLLGVFHPAGSGRISIGE